MYKRQGKEGVKTVLEIPLAEQERADLFSSAARLKEAMRRLDGDAGA